MFVEISEHNDGLFGDEVWVRVLSDTVVDWPRVKASLTPAQAELLEGCDLRRPRFYPDSSDERADRGSYKFEDHWVFAVSRVEKDPATRGPESIRLLAPLLVPALMAHFQPLTRH